MSRLKVVILVGGPGTRLQPLTFNTPKPMVPVLNRPFLEHTIAYLKQFDIEDIILAMSYLPEVIQDYFGDGCKFGVRLTYSLEKDPLGTAGAVKNAERYLDSTFVVLNGDIFTDLDIADMLKFHLKNKATATISLSRVDNPGAFGVVETDDRKRVKRFVEKPPPGQATTDWINAGTYILEPGILQHIPANSHYMFEKGLFPALINLGEPVYAYPYRGYWLDMGSPEKYFSLNHDLLLKINSPLVNISRDGIHKDSSVTVPASAVITPPVIIGKGSRIGSKVHIKGPAVIGPDCNLEEKAMLENTILWDNVHIGANARLNRCIIGSRVTIKPDSQLSNQIITSSRTRPLS